MVIENGKYNTYNIITSRSTVVFRADLKACFSPGVGDGRGRKRERRAEREGKMKMKMRMRMMYSKKKKLKKKRNEKIYFRANGTKKCF